MSEPPVIDVPGGWLPVGDGAELLAATLRGDPVQRGTVDLHRDGAACIISFKNSAGGSQFMAVMRQPWMEHGAACWRHARTFSMRMGVDADTPPAHYNARCIPPMSLR